MSTLTVSNVSDGSLSIPTTYVTNGSAKAWWTVSAASSLRDGFNVSSIVDDATGRDTINFTNNFSNDDYGVSTAADGTLTSNFCSGPEGKLSGSVSLRIAALAGDTATDRVHFGAAHGDLA